MNDTENNSGVISPQSLAEKLVTPSTTIKRIEDQFIAHRKLLMMAEVKNGRGEAFNRVVDQQPEDRRDLLKQLWRDQGNPAPGELLPVITEARTRLQKLGEQIALAQKISGSMLHKNDWKQWEKWLDQEQFLAAIMQPLDASASHEQNKQLTSVQHKVRNLVGLAELPQNESETIPHAQITGLSMDLNAQASWLQNDSLGQTRLLQEFENLQPPQRPAPQRPRFQIIQAGQLQPQPALTQQEIQQQASADQQQYEYNQYQQCKSFEERILGLREQRETSIQKLQKTIEEIQNKGQAFRQTLVQQNDFLAGLNPAEQAQWRLEQVRKLFQSAWEEAQRNAEKQEQGERRSKQEAELRAIKTRRLNAYLEENLDRHVTEIEQKQLDSIVKRKTDEPEITWRGRQDAWKSQPHYRVFRQSIEQQAKQAAQKELMTQPGVKEEIERELREYMATVEIGILSTDEIKTKAEEAVKQHIDNYVQQLNSRPKETLETIRAQWTLISEQLDQSLTKVQEEIEWRLTQTREIAEEVMQETLQALKTTVKQKLAESAGASSNDKPKQDQSQETLVTADQVTKTLEDLLKSNPGWRNTVSTSITQSIMQRIQKIVDQTSEQAPENLKAQALHNQWKLIKSEAEKNPNLWTRTHKELKWKSFEEKELEHDERLASIRSLPTLPPVKEDLVEARQRIRRNEQLQGQQAAEEALSIVVDRAKKELKHCGTESPDLLRLELAIEQMDQQKKSLGIQAQYAVLEQKNIGSLEWEKRRDEWMDSVDERLTEVQIELDPDKWREETRKKHWDLCRTLNVDKDGLTASDRQETSTRLGKEFTVETIKREAPNKSDAASQNTSGKSEKTNEFSGVYFGSAQDGSALFTTAPPKYLRSPVTLYRVTPDLLMGRKFSQSERRETFELGEPQKKESQKEKKRLGQGSNI